MAKPDVDAILKEARARFKVCAEAEDGQRKSILLAKQFRAGDQWPEDVKLARAGAASQTGIAAQPPRPCLTIDRLSLPVRQTSNAIRAANFSVKFLPNGHGSDVETAKIFDGIARRMQNQARGEDPIAWAADGAAEGGIGWVRLVTRFVKTPPGHKGPELFDQECVLERITNSLSVYCDPASQKPTKADARFMFVTEDLPRDEAKSKHGLSDEDMKALDDFMSTGDTITQGWASEKDGTVRVVDYYRLVYEDQRAYLLTSGEIVDTKPDDAKLIKAERVSSRPTVKVSKLCAVKEIDKKTFPGTRIPLFPIMGEELNVDGKVIVRGIIQPGMDAQRMVNYTYSGAIESVALAPKAPFIVAEGQLEGGYAALWQNANRFNYSYLPYKPVSLLGQPVAPPQRDNVEPPIQAMVQMLLKSEEAVKVTTGVFDPSLGKSDPNLKTARATLAVIQEAEQGRSHYLDNTRRALIDIGDVCCEVFPIIYDRPGRILDILGMDDKPEQVMIGQPYEEKGREMQPLPPDVAQQKLAEGVAKFYDLTKGQYAVTVDVGKAHSTARQEGNEAMGELIPHMPPQMQMAVLPSYVEGLNFPGAHEAADIMRKTLPPELRQTGDGDGPDMTTLQQENMQLKQQLEQVTGFAQQLHEQVQTKQVEQQGKLQEATLKEQAENQREEMRLQTEQALGMAKLQIEMRRLEVQAEIEAAKLGSAESLKRLEMEQQQLHAHSEQQLAQQKLGADMAGQEMDRQSGRDEAREQRQFEGGQQSADRELTREQTEAQRDDAERDRQFQAGEAERQRQAEAQRPEAGA